MGGLRFSGALLTAKEPLKVFPARGSMPPNSSIFFAGTEREIVLKRNQKLFIDQQTAKGGSRQ
jgi:hypothetical protein